MRTIQLTKGAVALVDDEDYERLLAYKWHLAAGRYAARRLRDYEDPASPLVYMHSEILQPPMGLVTDHIDSNTLNNQRANLRAVTSHQNSMRRSGKNKYRGVTIRKRDGKWTAQIKVLYHEINLGAYVTAEEAAAAYNSAAVKHFGEFAVLNVLPLRVR